MLELALDVRAQQLAGDYPFVAVVFPPKIFWQVHSQIPVVIHEDRTGLDTQRIKDVSDRRQIATRVGNRAWLPDPGVEGCIVAPAIGRCNYSIQAQERLGRKTDCDARKKGTAGKNGGLSTGCRGGLAEPWTAVTWSISRSPRLTLLWAEQAVVFGGIFDIIIQRCRW
jgi:hypothetical protein